MAGNADAVSEVVGEMLMIALVLILVAGFGCSIGSLIPHDRDPTITLLVTNTSDNFTLWHKGGDWVRVSEITVTVSNSTRMEKFNGTTFCCVPNATTFDLGGAITVPYQVQGDEEFRVFTPRIVLMTGRFS
ncbi:type IV pilin [Methanoculleus taiwanensis]|uniref:type IV pilin n=1 Tax=Methanoculleus taiwanensis TaxID=1550565 RepID=UPI000FFE909C|nr:type IV pilin N-terminal domain-containing protein [Methanoculleus taiwanensis]